LAGSRVAKVLLLFETAKHFDGKFYYDGKKGGESAKYLMLVSFQTNFVLSQIWICGKNFVPLPSKPQ